MSLAQSIRDKVMAAFTPERLELENESHKHGFSRGPEGHFKLIVVSESFEGLSSMERHQKVFTVLKEEMTVIHALSLRALTPAESESSSDFESPSCRHHKG